MHGVSVVTQGERDEINYYLRRTSGSSTNMISWRHPTAPCDVEYITGGLSSTVGHFLPQPHVSSISRPLLPPALLPLTAFNEHRLKLERVPTPTRADRLFFGYGEEHEVKVCFPLHSWRTEIEDLRTSTHSRASGVQDDGTVTSCRPSHCQHNQIDSVDLAVDAVEMTDGWEDMVGGSSRLLAGGDRDDIGRQVNPGEKPGQMAISSDAGSDEVDGDHLTQVSNDLQPSAVRRRSPPSLPRYKWVTTAARRRAVELDAKYWERRRKNNEAAKRSRDIRRDNERRVAMRAALLERENARLRSEVDILTHDTLRLHYYLLCSRTFGCSHCHGHARE